MTNNTTEPEIPAKQEVATPAENNMATGAVVNEKEIDSVTENAPLLVEGTLADQKDPLAFDPKDKKYQSDFGKAIDMANSSSHEEAVPYIDEFFIRYPEMPKDEKSYLYYLMGFTLHHDKGDYPEALKYYDLAINSVPEPEGICYYDRGLLKKRMGDNAGRDADFAMFVKLRPDMADWVDEKYKINAGQGAGGTKVTIQGISGIYKSKLVNSTRFQNFFNSLPPELRAKVKALLNHNIYIDALFEGDGKGTRIKKLNFGNTNAENLEALLPFIQSFEPIFKSDKIKIGQVFLVTIEREEDTWVTISKAIHQETEFDGE
jgi:tetratricopeptide (TPR) repeat protein